jgi:hypothetical protein
LNRVSKKFVKAVLERLPEGGKKQALAEIVGKEEAFDDYVFTRDYTDVLIEYPVRSRRRNFSRWPTRSRRGFIRSRPRPRRIPARCT